MAEVIPRAIRAMWLTAWCVLWTANTPFWFGGVLVGIFVGHLQWIEEATDG